MFRIEKDYTQNAKLIFRLVDMIKLKEEKLLLKN